MADAQTLSTALRAPLVARLTAMADDELILGHRNAEWTGHAPVLEEDIALANLAQDEIGHAITWYGMRAAIDGSDPDQLVYFRDAPSFLNAWLVELPRGDWAFTMLRQYLFDAYESELLARLTHSSYEPLAQAAVKIGREELFHLRHSSLWLERLAYGTSESRQRLVSALASAWPLLPQLLAPMAGAADLHAAGIWPDPGELREAVVARTRTALEGVGLTVGPLSPASGVTDHRGTHPTHLGEILANLQSVARSDPEALRW
ncbi:MAG TPA: 1,2-phenylacetyl-CoA epoxidase subunit PaaC [Trueperaceae bacterium]|nr:1,2-phenylacetyl-CoA epoxidase subunit PaaC [Trueperaceae bacterium]